MQTAISRLQERTCGSRKDESSGELPDPTWMNANRIASCLVVMRHDLYKNAIFFLSFKMLLQSLLFQIMADNVLKSPSRWPTQRKTVETENCLQVPSKRMKWTQNVSSVDEPLSNVKTEEVLKLC